MEVTEMWGVIVLNAVIDLGIIAGVVISAIHFSNWHLLWFLLLILVTGYSFTKRKADK